MADRTVTQVTWFSTEGEEFTRDALVAGVTRAMELGLPNVAVASTTGKTGLVAMEVCEQLGYDGQLIVVGEHYGYHGAGVQKMTAATRSELEGRGARVFFGTHVLSSAERSFRFRYGGIGTLEIVADVLRRFSRGVKTGVEMALMLADAGWIPIDQEVVAVGGSGGGADTAVVVQPANTNDLFRLSVREIVAMPRTRMSESVAEVVALAMGGMDPDVIVEQTGYSAATVDRYLRELGLIREGLAAGETDLEELRYRIGRGHETTRIYVNLCERFPEPAGASTSGSEV